MAAMEAALEAIKLLDPGEKVNYTQIARKYKVQRSTLSKRHRGIHRSNAEKYEDHRLLNSTQERRLVEYIEGLCARGLPPTSQMIRNFAGELAGRAPGICWPQRFIERHKLELISRWTSGIDATRHRSDSTFKNSLYFELLERKIEQYKIESRQIYNMDEKGFLIGILSKSKRVFSRRQFERGKLKSMLRDGNKEWITAIACICADGTALTPSLICQTRSGNIQDSWLQDFDPSVHKAFLVSSPSGWTNHDIGVNWLKQVFDRETQAKAGQSYRLLILDGHGSHVTMDFIEYCDANKILLAIIPPHSTHTLQPLDVCVFGPLASAYSAGLASFMEGCQGLSTIMKRDFFRLFWAAWDTSLKPATILKAFETTGVAPFNPDRILVRFRTRRDDGPSSSESNTSVLSTSDWRKIERLLRQVVEDIYESHAAKLSRTIQAMSAENELLKHENAQLREALLYERNRRKRGKPLLLEAPEEYNGGAVSWSPAKVQQARDRQVRKDAESKRREELKAQKAALLEERRRQRAAAKEEREREQKALEAQEARVVRAVEKQLREEIKLAKKGKRKSLKPLEETPHDIEPVQSETLEVEDEMPKIGPSTRARARYGSPSDFASKSRARSMQ